MKNWQKNFSFTKPSFWIALFICGAGLLAFSVHSSQALGDYNKATNGTLTNTDWNNLLVDFLPTTGGWIDGNVAIGTSSTSTYALNVSGTINADVLSGALTGSVVAGNVTSGAFGSNYGGGNFSFPGDIAIGTTTFSGPLLNVAGDFYLYGGTGDANLSGGDANATDSTQIVSYLNGSLTFSNEKHAIADIDGDGLVSYSDADLILYKFMSGGTWTLDKAKYFGKLMNARAFSVRVYSLDPVNDGANVHIGTSLTDTNHLIVKNSGNVGIGTTNPAHRLEVVATAAPSIREDIAKFSVSDDVNSYISMFNNTGSNSVFDPSIIGYNGTSGRSGMQFIGGVVDDIGSTPILSFQARIGGNSGSAVSTRPIFDWNNYGTSVLRILANGNVGIGATNPGAKLEISSAGGANSGIKLNMTSASSYGTIDFYTPGGLSGQFVTTGASYSNQIFTGDQVALASYLANGKTTIVAGGANGFINFATGGIGAANERMRITAGGNVGIGTTAPTTAKLVVNNGGSGYSIDVSSSKIGNLAAGTEAGDAVNYSQMMSAIASSSGSIVSYWNISGSNLFASSTSYNVGIGTTDPGSYKLKVAGNVAITGTLQTQTGSDFAEEFFTDQYLEPGTVVVMGDLGYKSVKPCTLSYDSQVVGIVSDNPSIIAGRVEGENKAIVAMMGVVSVKASTINGAIKRGDLLVSSGIKGYAMKSLTYRPGTIIGKALEGLKKDEGMIKVLVNLQ